MIIKGGYMKKKLLVLLIAVIPTLMPNLASAVAIDTGGDWLTRCYLWDDLWSTVTDC